jgi:hypothetical protein
MLDDAGFRRSMGLAVGSMWLIEGNEAATIADVKEQERLYEGLRTELTRRYDRLADLVTATHFGLKLDATHWLPLAAYATGRALTAPRQFDEWLERAEALAHERRFFHWELEFPEVFFDRYGEPLGERAGFDVVLGNPPYLRHERFSLLKPYLKETFPEVYAGTADLYVYFYSRCLRLTCPGGRMAYIVTNKWLRAGYGEPLRGYFAEQGVMEQIVDFGHAPVFEDADVFPVITVMAKPGAAPDGVVLERQVKVAAFPRGLLRTVNLSDYVQDTAHPVPHTRFGRTPWNLEVTSIDDLMAKLHDGGIRLRDFAGVAPLYGLKTGLNEAFLIDTPTKARLIAADARTSEIVKPYLRGQDMARWTPDWNGLWLLVIKSSSDHRWPWSEAVDDPELVFQQAFPAVYAYLKPFEDRLRKRQDQGRYWWELRSCAYYDLFDRPKIFYPDITWRSQFSVDTERRTSNNTVYFLPTDSAWLLAVLNSPLMWAYCWRRAVHGKDEALRFFSEFVEQIPVAPPTDEIRAEVEPAVERLIAITRADQAARRAMLDWLRTEMGVGKPGQRLEEFAALEADAFVEEVRKRRPGAAGAFTPATLQHLRSAYAEQAPPVRARRAEAAALERRLAELVNEAYGLTAEEVALLWETAPPRMPGTAPTPSPGPPSPSLRAAARERGA